MDANISSDAGLLTIADAGELIRTGKLSPLELTTRTFARIHKLDDQLKSHILLTEDAAMSQAKAAEADIAAGKWRGPLHGIPIGLKDIYNTAGIATTGHSALFKDHVPSEDATSVTLLRDAGAIFTGKLATWEFAIGGTSFDLPWPPARNPWDITRDPSGSSSGSGAAVAAGLCLGAMGSDTGGSIRGPAAWCGIAGHKPTYGLVSKAGVLPLSYSLDHAGPMCWTAEDCALMMQALAGYDPTDGCSADVPKPDFSDTISPIKDLRIGVVRHFWETDLPCEHDVAAATEDAIKLLADLGAMISNVTIAPFGAYGAAAGQISRAESFSVHEHWLTTTPEKYGAIGRQRLSAGAFVRGSDYVNAQRERRHLVMALAETMKDVDILVFPTARKVAPVIGTDRSLGGAFYNRFCNLTGSPALSVCSGYSDEGLPYGLQFVGRPFEDPLVLRVGAVYERAAGWRTRRPAIATAM